MKERQDICTPFEMKNITIAENKFPLLVENHIAVIIVDFYYLMEMLE